MSTPRRRSREVALQIVHQMDVVPDLSADAALVLFFAHFNPPSELDDEASTEETGSLDRPFVTELVEGVGRHRRELDDTVSRLSRNWRLERMAVVDRSVIRLALYELIHGTTPTAVVINEAVELAKRFGTSEAGAFVNGLLEKGVNELAIRR